MSRFLPSCFCLIAFIAQATSAHDSDNKMPWTIGINIAETAAFVTATQIVDWPVTFIPVHIDASYMFSKRWGMAFGLVYRYENYHDKNPVNKDSLHSLWTNYHEIFLLAGPRYSFFNAGNEGLYASVKAGPGGGFSSGGYAITALFQPEIGYGFIFGERPALHLDVGLGLLLNFPVAENPKLGFKLTPIGWLVHRTIPIIKFDLGIAF